MKRFWYGLTSAMLLTVMLCAGVCPALMPTPVAATTNEPLDLYVSLQTYIMTHYDSQFGTRDVTLLNTGTEGESGLDLSYMENLRYPKTNMKLDLSESTVISDPGFTNETIRNTFFSTTMASSNWTTMGLDDGTGTANCTVVTNPVLSGQQTSLTFNSTMDSSAGDNPAATDTAYWFTGFWQDVDGDGTYGETAEPLYTELVNRYTKIYISATLKTNGFNASTEANSYQRLAFQFAGSGPSDYIIYVDFELDAGDSAWTFSTSNGATLNLYDCQGTTAIDVALVLDVEQIVFVEDSEGIDIAGLKYIWVNQTYNETADSTYMYMQLHNIAFFNDLPYLTAGDMDRDYDTYSATTGLWINEDDDSDLLFCTITEGTTEAYDAQLPLYDSIDLENGAAEDLPYYTLDFAWRKMYFTGSAEWYPSDDFDSLTGTTRVSRWGGALDSLVGDYYESEVYAQWDSDIDSFFVSTTRYPVWSTDYLNFTVYKIDFWSPLKDAADDILAFGWSSSGGDVQLSEINTFVSLISNPSDSTEYQYDCAAISQTADSSPKMYLMMRTDSGFDAPTYDGTGIGTVTTTSPTTTPPPVGITPPSFDLTYAFALLLVAVLGVIGVAYLVTRGKQRKRGSQTIQDEAGNIYRVSLLRKSKKH